MKRQRLWIVLMAIPIFLAAVFVVSADRPHPATAGGVIDPSCSSTLPCIEYDNNAAGAAIRGVSAAGVGVAGWTRNNSTSAANGWAGLYGKDVSTSGTFNSGVNGLSVRGTGVSGTSTSGFGVHGISTSNDGVFGLSTNAVGVVGQSTNYLGVLGAGITYGTYGSATTYGVVGNATSYGVFGEGNSYGVYGTGGSSGIGVYGTSVSGQGVYASTSSGRPFEGHTSSGVGLYVTNGSGNGGDVAGTNIGFIARSNTFPIVATDSVGNDLFYVDGSGNVFYHGSLTHFAVTRTGKYATAYGSTAASPTVEDTGSAELINGVAMVALDSAFVETMEPRAPYHVMLTPDGDTRGLFVASKGPRGFVVREVQGGHSSLTFDYHIYAAALGHAGQRMVVLSGAQAAFMLPRAPLVAPAKLAPQVPLPKLKLPQITH